MDDDKNTPFWQSRKFWYSVLATIAFLALAITKTVEFTSDQVMTFILALLGITVGGHTVTDVGSQIARAIATRAQGAIESVAGAIAKPAEEEGRVVNIDHVADTDADGDGDDDDKGAEGGDDAA